MTLVPHTSSTEGNYFSVMVIIIYVRRYTQLNGKERKTDW